MKRLMMMGVAVLALAGCSSNDEYNRWADDCEDAGGIVSGPLSIDEGFWTTKARYECYIDGEKVVLPGWEGS